MHMQNFGGTNKAYYGIFDFANCREFSRVVFKFDLLA